MVYNLVALQDAANGRSYESGHDCGPYRNLLLFHDSPSAEKQKEIKKFREGLTVGDKVITAGGIYGKIRGVKETSFVLEIADGVKITIDKGSVYPSAAEAQESAKQNEGNPGK